MVNFHTTNPVVVTTIEDPNFICNTDEVVSALENLEVNIGNAEIQVDNDDITSNIQITNELITGLNSNVVASNIALLNRLNQQLSVNTISGFNLESTQLDVLSNVSAMKTSLEGQLSVNTISGFNLESTQLDVLSNVSAMKTSLEGQLSVNTISGFNLESTQVDVLSNIVGVKSALEGTLDVNTISGFNLETTQEQVLSNVSAMKTSLEGQLSVNTISGFNLETTQVDVLSNIVAVKSALEGELSVNTISGFNLETTQQDVLSNVTAMKTALEGTLDVNTISGFNLETTQQDVLSNVSAMKTALEGTLDVNTISGFNLETTQQDVLSNITAMKTALEGTLDVNTISGFNLETTQLDILSNIQASNIALVNAINGISTGGGSLDDTNITSNLQIIAEQQKYDILTDYNNNNSFPTVKMVGYEPEHGGVNPAWHVIHATQSGEMKVNISGVEATEAFLVSDVDTHSNLQILQNTQLDVLSNIQATQPRSVYGSDYGQPATENELLVDSNGFISGKLYGMDYSQPNTEQALRVSSSGVISSKIYGYNSSISNDTQLQLDSNNNLKTVVDSTTPVNVNISQQTSTLSVSGTVAVSNTGFDVNNFPATQAVSGTVAVSNTGFDVNNFPATQAVSGTVAVSNTGFDVNNFPATQAVSGTVAISNTGFDVNNFPATQAVSASSLPLPTGASTSVNQTTTHTKIDNINNKIVESLKIKRADGKCRLANAYFTTGSNSDDCVFYLSNTDSTKSYYVYNINVSCGMNNADNNNSRMKVIMFLANDTRSSGGTAFTYHNAQSYTTYNDVNIWGSGRTSTMSFGTYTIANPFSEIILSPKNGESTQLDFQEEYIEIKPDHSLIIRMVDLYYFPNHAYANIRWFEE